MSMKNTKNTQAMDKHSKRMRRASKARAHIKKLGVEKNVYRLTVFRSNQHIYAQILAPVGGNVCAYASSLEKDIKSIDNTEGGKVALAKAVGHLIAERAKVAGIGQVAFDRSGFKYHGRIAALVESARENGLQV